MKKILFLILVAFTLNAKAQVVFEHAYDSASTISSGGTLNQLMLINFEVSGYQYVKINQWDKSISIYDINHSLLKTISVAGFPSTTYQSDILYLSETLFNTDSKKEFMYSFHNGSSNYYTGIYNEDGTLIFSDTGLAAIRTSVPLQQYPIYNTPNGTKMILSYRNGQAKVFGLAGTLTTAVDRANTQLANNGAMLANARPNPTANTTTIDYTLPQDTNQGELVFYNTQGTEVKRFKVDNTFNSLLISTTDIAAGTYYYNLQISGNPSAAKKMVVVK